ncbi:hypothetical protein S70_15510 [Providencia stuartii MRSN 2154]|uniref:Uncharacterized protein n=1 Tax=Providencia stuartii (strain MRSN 2154) TaxID=1157951 RepID=A0A140NP88_PROSM|nr:hypothetical protein S70_15510 [Providencia stuartii MRSN 2154]
MMNEQSVIFFAAPHNVVLLDGFWRQVERLNGGDLCANHMQGKIGQYHRDSLMLFLRAALTVR